ncbi:MAG: hypothetical protein H6603_06145 [Flavobacteriales bacterium]|nr:hypothetical protein [Flavobacteriales bacterium]MCB9192452.1 hypothetical protein [Flavobacteriales bacterium]MCB9204542.1 hypothetical protein [Flavobacteriales bacterium]
MKTIKLLTTAVLMAATSVAFAQKTKITKGDFTELKGQTEVNVVWDYSEAQVRGGSPFATWKAMPEADWLQKIVDKKNEKEAGTGDDWKKRWEAAKPNNFESSFETKMAEMWEGALVKRGLDNAKYTIRVKVTYMDPGYSVGVSASDAWLSGIIEVVEGDNVTSSLTMDMIKGASAAKSIPGMAVVAAIEGATFEKRLGESFEKMAKSFHAKVLKKAFK